jgi:hypothetical protein
MNYESQSFQTMPMMNSDYDEPLNDEQDESPILACLRAKNRSKEVMQPLSSQSSHSVYSTHSATSDLDDNSLCPLDAFEDDDDMLSIDDAKFVDFALRISADSVSTGFHDSTTSGFSLDDNSFFELANDIENDEGEHQNAQNAVAAPVYQDTMESLNQSISSLNDAFEKLTSCMDRTAQSRSMLKQFKDTTPGGALSDESSQRSLGGLGGSSHGPRRKSGLSRSSSNTSLNSHGSSRSLGSLGRKSKIKRTRKLRRHVKSDLHSDLRRDLTRGGFTNQTMPHHIILHDK